MKKAFCTISTPSHLYKCFALADSISKHGGFLSILVVDRLPSSIKHPSNVSFFSLEDIKDPIGIKIITKYARNTDKLRWSLKSIFLNFLLSTNEKVVYVDNDICFFDDFQFLFDDLDHHPVLLTPHHYLRDPLANQNWLEANFRVGLYNAGFVGVNSKAVSTLNWWAKSCLYRCEKNYFRGLYDDQKYLDLFPVIEPKTKVLTHLGCNVAEWNKVVCRQTIHEKQVLINNTFPVVFYHFSPYSLREISKENPLFKEYFERLKTYRPKILESDLMQFKPTSESIKFWIWKLLNSWNGSS